jgi:hypothetical protein
VAVLVVWALSSLLCLSVRWAVLVLARCLRNLRMFVKGFGFVLGCCFKPKVKRVSSTMNPLVTVSGLLLDSDSGASLGCRLARTL